MPVSAVSRGSREEQLLQEWKRSGKSPYALQPLLSSLAPLIQSYVNKYRAADVSQVALKTEAENIVIRGLGTYSPSKGSLSTYLNWQLRGLGRFVEKHQNLARIPGSRIRFVGRFQAATSALQEELGRAPTLTEVARRGKIPRTHVQRLQEELRTVHITGMEMGPNATSPSEIGTYSFSADKERLELIYPDLTAIEQQVVDFTSGRGRKPIIASTNVLARKLKVSPARISNIRASIARKVQALSWIR